MLNGNDIRKGDKVICVNGDMSFVGTVDYWEQVAFPTTSSCYFLYVRSAAHGMRTLTFLGEGFLDLDRCVGLKVFKLPDLQALLYKDILYKEEPCRVVYTSTDLDNDKIPLMSVCPIRCVTGGTYGIKTSERIAIFPKDFGDVVADNNSVQETKKHILCRDFRTRFEKLMLVVTNDKDFRFPDPMQPLTINTDISAGSLVIVDDERGRVLGQVIHNGDIISVRHLSKPRVSRYAKGTGAANILVIPTTLSIGSCLWYDGHPAFVYDIPDTITEDCLFSITVVPNEKWTTDVTIDINSIRNCVFIGREINDIMNAEDMIKYLNKRFGYIDTDNVKLKGTMDVHGFTWNTTAKFEDNNFAARVDNYRTKGLKDTTIASIEGLSTVDFRKKLAEARIKESSKTSGRYPWGQENDNRITLVTDGVKVVKARCGWIIATARCHDDDTFDFFTGAKIALERLEAKVKKAQEEAAFEQARKAWKDKLTDEERKYLKSFIDESKNK